jgi:hypothetical protein
VKRRTFIAGLGSAAALPVVVRAQQAGMPVIGYLGSQSAGDDYKYVTTPFLQGLKETGYVVGQNAAIEYRWAENQYDRLPALAADLVRRRVAVIAANETPGALAAKTATTTIPIVFTTGVDPVAISHEVSKGAAAALRPSYCSFPKLCSTCWRSRASRHPTLHQRRSTRVLMARNNAAISRRAAIASTE